MSNDAVPSVLAAPLEAPGGRAIPDHPLAMLTTAQAAGVLGLSARTLEQLRVKGGGPPHFALGRRAVRYRRSDLDAWLDARRRKSTSDPGPSEPEAAS